MDSESVSPALRRHSRLAKGISESSVSSLSEAPFSNLPVRVSTRADGQEPRVATLGRAREAGREGGRPAREKERKREELRREVCLWGPSDVVSRLLACGLLSRACSPGLARASPSRLLVCGRGARRRACAGAARNACLRARSSETREKSDECDG